MAHRQAGNSRRGLHVNLKLVKSNSFFLFTTIQVLKAGPRTKCVLGPTLTALSPFSRKESHSQARLAWPTSTASILVQYSPSPDSTPEVCHSCPPVLVLTKFLLDDRHRDEYDSNDDDNIKSVL